MLTQALLKILYMPVVLQSLCVLHLKPKMQIQTCIYILTQTLLVVKYKPLTDEILRLMLCKSTSKEFAAFLSEKDLYKPFLYSEKF